jgi:WD40 repeat protein
MAKVTIAFDSWKDGAVAPTQHEMEVISPRSTNLKLETVSSRLKGELIHPNKNSSIAKVEFSPDGKHLLAGDYPGGVIALWDVASGKRLTTIEAGYGYHATSNYYAVSPDWRTVFAWREKRKAERVEQDGKRMIRWTFGGEVRAWDLEDGKLLRTYKRQPQSNVRIMRLAPDGKTFYTFEELPGTYERGSKNATSLWDVKAGTYRTLEGVDSYGSYSPDGKALALPNRDEDGYSHGLKLIDVASGREKWSIPISDKYAWVNVGCFSPDGRLLFGTVRVFERAKQWDKSRSHLKWWDAATGHEVASFDCEPNESAGFSILSPDQRIAVALNWQGDKKKLMLFNVPEKRLERTIIVCEKTEGLRSIASSPLFSPDGKWLVVITRKYPEKTVGDDLDPRDVPQPRILVIETATGAIRETIIQPHSFSYAACFSPDGRTLATGGHGRVLLWDMTKMPGS